MIPSSAVIKIQNALETTFRFLAADELVCVDGAGVQLTVPAMIQGVKNVENNLDVDQAGTRFNSFIEATVYKNDLDSEGVDLYTTIYFLVNGIRHDYAIGDGFEDSMVPLGALNNLVVIKLRKATEREQTETVTTIGYVE